MATGGGAEEAYPSTPAPLPHGSHPRADPGIEEILDVFQCPAPHLVSDLDPRRVQRRIGFSQTCEQLLEMPQPVASLTDATLLVGQPLKTLRSARGGGRPRAAPAVRRPTDR